ncbi:MULTISPECIES: type III polyketide synthase [unclassified Arthrobacter]|uniref:type III polyketide synthase n=1 Tax=unclassified Arthrobacter TaxID=235627 RepID=UPI001E3F8425|nr:MULTISPECIES: type III polyketide synthase [unclassified Arthrobacter]MCC9145874.1 type III polyketide synthase [Arthrobacter sp. zg-Y919]MDK1277103.1 type III polyketide synthase [Arthrobacter sp. zg.Y919]WIB03626.1 type III polyketide synthase [Arthrobacter sp. zg-Y919]
MTVTLRSLETAIPPTVLVQSEVRDTFVAQPGLTRLGQRLVRTCFDSAAIDTRRTALAELSLTDTSEHPLFYDARSGLLLRPSTKTRNDIFAVEATKLFIEAASKALAACTGINAADITHVITVSCTGFFNPGPDYKVTRALGLNPSVQRYHLGFMGCYAAFPAMRAAKSFCEADPRAVVLVVSAELCSLHVRTSNDPDAILGSSLFADGAAAAVITARDDLPDAGPAIQLDHFETVLTPVGEEAMAWNIGDEGFEMVLGTYVPHIIDDHIVGALAPLLAHDESVSVHPYRDIGHWAIHPGGRAILDKVEAKLELSAQQLGPARETLRTVGNMSSATVLFVLKYILEQPFTGGNERICSMAFGPGLTVETGLFTRVGGPVQPAAAATEQAAVPGGQVEPAGVPA